MSWTSLDEDDATSSSDEEDIATPSVPGRRIDELDKIDKKFKELPYFGVEKSQGQLSPCNPHVQEPNSDNELNSRRVYRTQEDLKSLLAAKEERIRVLQKLVNGQREQLYYFLNLSLKEETLIELKKSCRETEALNRNESMSMALDKFKYDNHLPTEQTLLRKDVSKILYKIEKLMKRQAKLVKTMESDETDDQLREAGEKSIEMISCYRSDDQLTDVQKLLKGTKYVQRKAEMLKIQLKRLALIEEERNDLVERVYSMPADQRRYYAHLAVIEREKIQLLCEIDKLTENYRDLKQKCSLLEGTEHEFNKSIDAKIADIDLNDIKPGLEKHLELMDLVERGEVSLITITKDEKGKFKDDFDKLYNENAELSKRLKDFDEVTRERDKLKQQMEILVENSLRLQNEVNSLRLAGKKDSNLLEEMRKVCLEREQLRAKLERVSKDVPGILKIRDDMVEKITEERDQLRSKLAEYPNIEEEMKSLRLRAGQCEAHRDEADRLKVAVKELEDQVKTAQIALLDMNVRNPVDCRNMSKQLERLREAEEERERLAMEISRYKYALLQQEKEVKDLVNTVDKLMDLVKTLQRTNSAVNPAEGTPEGPEMTSVLNFEEENRLDAIRRRVRSQETSKPLAETSDRTIPTEDTISRKSHTIISSIKDISKTID